jgi:hypothetical protein
MIAASLLDATPSIARDALVRVGQRRAQTADRIATLRLASDLLFVLRLSWRAVHIIGVLEHCALDLGIVHLLRKSASFLSAVSQCFGSLIEWSDTKLLPNLVGCTPI